MFELDYLTQRLTFTRATDTTNPAADRRLRPDVRGRGRRAAGRDRRAARRGARRVPRGRPRTAAGRSSTPRTACGRSPSPARCSSRRPAATPVDLSDTVHEVRRRMTIVSRPTVRSRACSAARSTLPIRACGHEPARSRSARGSASPGTAGRVAVVGAGKMGLPLAAQFADHGWQVTAVDVQQAVVDAINEGRSHVDEEPGLAELVRGRPRPRPPPGDDRRPRRPPARPTSSCSSCRSCSTTSSNRTTATWTRPSTSIGPGRPRGLARDLRDDPARRRHARAGSRPGSRRRPASAPTSDFFVAFSPERLYSGAVLRNLATYPKLVGGIGPASTARAAAFYDAVLDAEIVAMSSAEAAEFSKLADTTYRDVNIALANEFARYAERIGVDIHEVIAAANSQPYTHIHQPGLGVGGHCIPVYPHFLLSRAPELELVELSRRTNDGQVGVAIRALQQELGGLDGRADPRARPDLPPRGQGAGLLAGAAADRAADPPGRASSRPSTRCSTDDEIGALLRDCRGAGATPGPFRAIVTQTGRSAVRDARPGLVPGPRASSSTAATACATWPCRRPSRTAGSAPGAPGRPRRAARPRRADRDSRAGHARAHSPVGTH